jgi:heterodisulfide reductase subunit C/nitrate reductase gamma subunit
MTPTRETFGNISGLSQAIFYVLSAIAVGVFAYGVWRRARLWRQGQPGELRALVAAGFKRSWRSFRPGLRRLLVDALGQARVRGRGLASRAHLLLFYGFLMLFLGTTLLEIDHLAAMLSSRLKFHHGIYYVVYEFTLDLFGVLFLVGGGLFLWRRLRRPASVGHRPTDWYVLAIFLAIGVTGYFVEALRMVWQHPQGIGAHCSPVGGWLASGFGRLDDPSARAWHRVVWWLHSLLVLGFIASIPYTRLLHIIAGPLNLFLARPALGELTLITMEQVEKEERLGLREIRHLTTQQLLSLDACMECGRCEEACPAFATAKPLSPKRVVQDLKSVMNRLSPGQGAGAAAAVDTDLHKVIKEETLWSCTACSACAAVCPVRVDPVTLILEMRRHLLAESALRGTAATALRRIQSSGNPWGLPAANRAEWTQLLNPSPASTPSSGETSPSS